MRSWYFMQITVRVSHDNVSKEVNIPAAMLIAALTPELVGREDSEDPFFRTEILPLDPRVGLQVVCKNWGGKGEI